MTATKADTTPATPAQGLARSVVDDIARDLGFDAVRAADYRAERDQAMTLSEVAEFERLHDFATQVYALAQQAQQPAEASEREQFEAWAATERWMVSRNSFDEYTYDTVRDGWSAWQARAALAQQVGAGVERSRIEDHATLMVRLKEAIITYAFSESGKPSENWVKICELFDELATRTGLAQQVGGGDSERLDWLLSNPNEVLEGVGGWYRLDEAGNPTFYMSARCAIDASRASSAAQGEAGAIVQAEPWLKTDEVRDRMERGQ